MIKRRPWDIALTKNCRSYIARETAFIRKISYIIVNTFRTWTFKIGLLFTIKFTRGVPSIKFITSNSSYQVWTPLNKLVRHKLLLCDAICKYVFSYPFTRVFSWCSEREKKTLLTVRVVITTICSAIGGGGVVNVGLTMFCFLFL